MESVVEVLERVWSDLEERKYVFIGNSGGFF